MNNIKKTRLTTWPGSIALRPLTFSTLGSLCVVAVAAAFALPCPAYALQRGGDQTLKALQNSRGVRSQKAVDKIRFRVPGFHEKQNERTLKSLAPAVANVKSATFEVLVDKYWAAMGMVITTDGYAVTKASELQDSTVVFCRFGKKNRVEARVVSKDTKNDVALLKLEAGTYSTVKLGQSDLKVGTVVLTAGVRKDVLAMGVCSVGSRSLLRRGQGFLGVMPTEVSAGIQVASVQKAALRAGMKDGDIIVKINKRVVSKLNQFVNMIRRYHPGDTITIHAIREAKTMEFTVTLDGRRQAGRAAARFVAMDLLGTIKSGRSDKFPWVSQHDSALMPEHCGGPLVDLEGQVVGMNIARGGRIGSYAISGPRLTEILEQWDLNPSRK